MKGYYERFLKKKRYVCAECGNDLIIPSWKFCDDKDCVSKRKNGKKTKR